MISTATVEATHDAQVREALMASLRRLDAAFESRFRFAPEQGETLPSDDLKGLPHRGSPVRGSAAGG